MEHAIETLKEWVVDIAIFLALTIVTAGLEARHHVGVSCGSAPTEEAP
jgi:hypothetical protein